jgi:hypothetical protein
MDKALHKLAFKLAQPLMQMRETGYRARGCNDYGEIKDLRQQELDLITVLLADFKAEILADAKASK